MTVQYVMNNGTASSTNQQLFHKRALDMKCTLRLVGYNHLIFNNREWNKCFIKNYQQTLLDFADFALLEQPEGTLMDVISRVWYNGSYTIAAKPIKTLELHYTIIQFLIICNTCI